MLSLPADVHSVIIKYLPLKDVVYSYQLTCSWYEYATMYVLTLDLTTMKNITSPLKRFYNVEELYVSWVSNAYQVYLDLLRECHNLRILYIGSITCTPRLDELDSFYAMFPKYSAIIPTYEDNPIQCRLWPYDIYSRSYLTEEKIEQIIKHQTITHVLVCYETLYKPIADAILPHAAKTMTNLTIQGIHESEELATFLLRYLPPVTNLTRIYFTSTFNGKKSKWVEIVRRSPYLLEYDGPVDEEIVNALSAYCPNFKSLQGLHIDKQTQQLITRKLKKLKILRIYILSELIDEDMPALSELEILDGDRVESYQFLKHTPNLKRLDVKIGDQFIDDVVSYCPNLDSITVHPDFKAGSAKKLLKGCPRLRFITGMNKRLQAPRLEDGTIDVIKWREECITKRPKKKIKI